MSAKVTASLKEGKKPKAEESTKWPFDWITFNYDGVPLFAAKAIADVKELIKQREKDGVSWKDVHHFKDILNLLIAKVELIQEESKKSTTLRNASVDEVHRAIAILALPREWARYKLLEEINSDLGFDQGGLKASKQRVTQLKEVASLKLDGEDAGKQMEDILNSFQPFSERSLVIDIDSAVFSALVAPRPTRNTAAPIVGKPFDWIPADLDTTGLPFFVREAPCIAQEIQTAFEVTRHVLQGEQERRERNYAGLLSLFEDEIKKVENEMQKEPSQRKIDVRTIARLAWPVEEAKLKCIRGLKLSRRISQAAKKELDSAQSKRIQDLRDCALQELHPVDQAAMKTFIKEIGYGRTSYRVKRFILNAALSAIENAQ